MKKVLVTGSAGFIGFSLSKRLLDSGINVIGIDSITDYYDICLKRERHNILNKNKNFNLYEVDLKNYSELEEIFKKHNPDIIIHLAAQAGVRHSILEPENYIEANIIGSFNLLECIRYHGCKHLLIASTSSVYGSNKKMPYHENDKSDTQLSLYAATKKSVESISHSYSHLFDIPTTIFRFFTVYGPWGRPDMAYFSFTKAILESKPIDIYNNGNLKRDFTYIDDLTKSVELLIDKIPSFDDDYEDDSLSDVSKYRIVNIGNSKPVNLMKFIESIEKSLGKKAIKNYVGMQPGDVEATWANSDLLYKLIGYLPNTDIETGVGKFIKWYMEYYQIR